MLHAKNREARNTHSNAPNASNGYFFIVFSFKIRIKPAIAVMHGPQSLVRFGEPGRVAQSVEHLTRKSGVLGSIPGLATYFRFSFRFFKKGSCQVLAKVCAVLVNRLGGLSLPRESVVRLTDRPDMTLDVYRGRKTSKQQQQQQQPIR